MGGPFTKQDILGEALDPQILNKVRFALTTIEMAHDLKPESFYIHFGDTLLDNLRLQC